MLDARVARLEADMSEVKASLKAIEAAIAYLPTAADLTTLRVDVAEMKGRVSQLPTAWMMFIAIVTTVVTTWSAGAAMVFTVLRLSKP